MNTIALAVVCVASSIALLRHEARHPDPVLPVRALRRFAFARLQGAAVLTQLCCFSIMLLAPYWIAARPDYTPWRLGLLLALFPLGSVVANACAGAIARRIAAISLVRAGMAMSAFGLAGIGLAILAGPLDGQAVLHVVAGALFVTGVGLGVFQLGYADATTNWLPLAQRGVAGGLINVTRLVGFVFGAALISALHASLQGRTDVTMAFGWSFALLGVGLGVVTLVLLRRDDDHRDESTRTHRRDEPAP
jgi:DHA2 family multidrug resistance protein-like MFS transporter